ncbi:MAG: DUF58 domain-containing protein [Verrucomicrobiales bacterium]
MSRATREPELRSGKLKWRPTGAVIGMTLLLLACFYAGASQGNGVAYAFGFLLLAMCVASGVQAWRLVKRAELRLYDEQVLAPADQESWADLGQVVGGEGARWEVFLWSAGKKVATCLSAKGVFHVGALPRGVHRIDEIELATRFPLGLIQVSKCEAKPLELLIYPNPQGRMDLPEDAGVEIEAELGAVSSWGSDFVGHRPWREGESQRRVDWKSVARGRGYQSKVFGGARAREWLLDWEGVPGNDMEERLRQLAKWVDEAVSAEVAWSLRLPDTSLALASGQGHLWRSWAALARVPREGETPSELGAVSVSSTGGEQE